MAYFPDIKKIVGEAYGSQVPLSILLILYLTRNYDGKKFKRCFIGFSGVAYLLNTKQIKKVNVLVVNSKVTFVLFVLFIAFCFLSMASIGNPVWLLASGLLTYLIFRVFVIVALKEMEKQHKGLKIVPEKLGIMGVLQIYALGRFLPKVELPKEGTVEMKKIGRSFGIDPNVGSGQWGKFKDIIFWIFGPPFLMWLGIYIGHPYYNGATIRYLFSTEGILVYADYALAFVFVGMSAFLIFSIIVSYVSYFAFRLIKGRQVNMYDLVPHYDEVREIFELPEMLSEPVETP